MWGTLRLRRRAEIAGHPHPQSKPRYRCFLPDLTGFTEPVIRAGPCDRGSAPEPSDESTGWRRKARIGSRKRRRAPPAGASPGSRFDDPRATAVRLIGERPAWIERRHQAGHWEIDTVMGVGNDDCIVTLVERHGVVLIGKLMARNAEELDRRTIRLINKDRHGAKPTTSVAFEAGVSDWLPVPGFPSWPGATERSTQEAGDTTAVRSRVPSSKGGRSARRIS